METIQFLRNHSLAELCERYAISAKRHGKFPSLVLLKYSQIDSPMGERIVQECRGLILDESENWRPVCRAYDKFFNHGEGHAAPIDWSTARVYEKLDGSLMTLYYYAGQWRVSSSGLPDAAGPVNNGYRTFADLFWAKWKLLEYSLPHGFEDYCFMFELMTPHNRVVVPHTVSRIVLHGVRNLRTMEENGPEDYDRRFNWECVRSFPLGAMDDCLAAAAALDPISSEGYVVRDAQFRRIKVKSPAYVALAHLKEGMNTRRMLEIVRSNESAEFLTHFPEWTDAYARVRSKYDALCGELEADYRRLKDIPAQKDFAMEAVKTRASSVLFALRAGKCASAREFFASCTLQALERAIGLDGIELVPVPVESNP